eukprot:5615422-Pyramimonas_sp.AAC.1
MHIPLAMPSLPPPLACDGAEQADFEDVIGSFAPCLLYTARVKTVTTDAVVLSCSLLFLFRPLSPAVSCIACACNHVGSGQAQLEAQENTAEIISQPSSAIGPPRSRADSLL